jgi:hypothetical protein
MGDTLKRYRAVRDALNKIYPKQLTGNQARHLNTLASMISGIVGSQSTNLPDIAGKTAVEPYNNQSPANRESRVKKFSRLLAKKSVTQETYFMPFAAILLAALAHMPLVLAIDGSAVGMGCTALMIGIVYHKRLLPLAWIVREGKKGHFPEQIHLELLDLVRSLIPADAQVVLVGDGEFDGVEYQKKANLMGWSYVSRTASTIKLSTEDHEFSFDEMGQSIQPGERLAAPLVSFSNEEYGPVTAIAWWGIGYKEPIFLVTNIETVELACMYYKKRFKIETFFADQKSRGFYLHKSHVSDPDRLARLMIAACLAYYWIICLGVEAVRKRWHHMFHRKSRCDLSLFQIGLKALDYLLDEGLPIYFALRLRGEAS